VNPGRSVGVDIMSSKYYDVYDVEIKP